MIQAHHGPVIAVAVSPDGKFLATFSHLDQRLKFFQVWHISVSVSVGYIAYPGFFWYKHNSSGFVTLCERVNTN